MDAIVDDLVAHLLHIYSRFHPSNGIAKPQLTTKISLLGRHFGATGFRENHARITSRTFIFSSFLIQVTKINMAGNSSDGDIAVMVPMVNRSSARQVEERMDFITIDPNWTNFQTLLKPTLVEAHLILSMLRNSWNWSRL
jgi:hypothetical protein